MKVEERIVTDLVFLEIGVNIDFSYNQTRSDDGSSVSAPGCPKATEGRPWVYFGNPPKCVVVGFRGLCPWGQRVFQVENSNYGVCNCDCFATKKQAGFTLNLVNFQDIAHNLILHRKKRQIQPENISTHLSRKRCYKRNNAVVAHVFPSPFPLPLLSSSSTTKRYQFCFSLAHDRQVVYDSLGQKCYPFLDQGPCQPEEWLVRDLEHDDSVLCEKRKCPKFMGRSNIDYGESFTYFDPKRQQCFTELLGPHAESFHHSGTGISGSRRQFCKNAGMKYSNILKTCIKDLSSKYNFHVLG
ncbi:hypothetical protein Ocin01_16843 [Orchesella cincta]|uniref:DUF4789 domain-containing protein n=1 Tax=Orchesella cincta TaxID=48709 RepID=A0A1D2MA46_ORCCI|nr:hypothetical protein Ocin01_16843 [Orchesella cincta]